MIYKFRDLQGCYDMEVELFNEDNQSEGMEDSVELSLIREDSGENPSITLLKKDIYKLIGALHLIHKEMK